MNTRPLSIGIAAIASGFLLVACGSTAAESPDATPVPSPTVADSATVTPTSTPTEAVEQTVQIKIDGETLTPNAEKVKATVGEEVTLEVTSDRSGELHVHSTPDQQVEFTEGVTRATVRFDRPGLVDVEEHHSGKLLIQFEVR